jgi:outer membrane lipoprotein SlyB
MLTKASVVVVFLLTLSHMPLLQAAEIVAQRSDNLSGQMLGGWVAVLVGGAAGGPLGAIAGGALGAWLGGEAQQLAGASGDAYLVKMDDGEVRRLRSPNQQFEVGETVSVKGIRPVPVANEETLGSSN